MVAIAVLLPLGPSACHDDSTAADAAGLPDAAGDDGPAADLASPPPDATWVSDFATPPGFALLKDTDTQGRGVFGSQFMKLGASVLFGGSSALGSGLFATDGTAGSTRLISTVTPYPYYPFVQLGNACFFAGEDGSNPSQLWKTDGTPAGTSVVPGLSAGIHVPYSLTVAGGRLFFTDVSTTDLNRLASSDGITASVVTTSVVADRPVALGSKVLFAGTVNSDSELWISDGTQAGTHLVKDLNASGSSSPSYLTTMGPSVYFIADDGVHGGELWKSDGTDAGTALVADVQPGSAPSIESVLTVVGNLLYFIADDGVHGPELWRSDGTTAGTHLVTDIAPGVASSGIRLFVTQNGVLYFVATDAVTSPTLWHVDGPTASAVRLFDPSAPVQPNPQQMVSIGNRLVFTVINTNELWSSDGTSQGTSSIKVLRSFPYNANANSLTAVGDVAYLTVNDDTTDRALWRSDGTASGTASIDPHFFGATASALVPPPPTDPFGTVVSQDRMLYFASDGRSAPAPYITDGTIVGTLRLADVDCGDQSNFTVPDPVATASGHFFFVATDATHGTELWTTDGTIAGTHLVKDIATGTTSGLDRQGFTQLLVVGETIYFAANDGTHGFELWQSDGTDAGTSMVLDLYPGSASGLGVATAIGPLTAFDGAVFTLAQNPTQGLYRFDGAVATRLAAVQNDFSKTAVAGTTLFFTSGPSLWKSDGTPAGTSLLVTLAGGNPQFKALRAVGDKLAFVAPTATLSSGLWTSDGTPSGTTLVTTIDPAGYGLDYSADADSFGVVYHGKLYFRANNGIHFQLYASDLTAAGTLPVTQHTDPGYHELPTQLRIWNDRIYFADYDAAHGVELWSSDGTTAGSALVADMYNGPQGACYPLGGVTSRLLLSCDNGLSGGELWSYHPVP